MQLAVGDIWEAKIYCRLSEQIAINVIHYHVQITAGASVSDAQFAARLDFLYGAVYPPLLVEEAQYRGVGVKKLLIGGSTDEVFSTAAAAFGDVTGVALPKQTAGVIKKTTGLGGRRNRGRTYVPFPGEADNIEAGKPQPTYVARLLNLANVIEAGVVVGTAPDTAGCQPLVYSRVSGLWNVITQCLPRDRWGTQRRRGDFGAPNALAPM